MQAAVEAPVRRQVVSADLAAAAPVPRGLTPPVGRVLTVSAAEEAGAVAETTATCLGKAGAAS